jgi:hypothetical protein
MDYMTAYTARGYESKEIRPADPQPAGRTARYNDSDAQTQIIRCSARQEPGGTP